MLVFLLLKRDAGSSDLLESRVALFFLLWGAGSSDFIYSESRVIVVLLVGGAGSSDLVEVSDFLRLKSDLAFRLGRVAGIVVAGTDLAVANVRINCFMLPVCVDGSLQKSVSCSCIIWVRTAH